MSENLPSTIDIVTPREAAKILQVSSFNVYVLIETDPTFPAIQIDQKWIIDRMKLNAWGIVNKSLIEKSPSTLDIINLPEAAEILRVCLNTIYAMIETDPTFPAVKINNMWRIHRVELKAWYENKFTNKILPQSELEGVRRGMIERSSPTFDILTRKEATQILRFSKVMFCHLTKTDPTFPAVKISKKWVVDRTRLEAWYEVKFSNNNLPPLEFKDAPITEEEA